MASHCGKHDIVYAEGGQCWCCEESAMTPDQKTAAYKDPKFLAKRASGPSTGYTPAPFDPSTLTDEQVLALQARFTALAATPAAPAATPAA